MSPRIARRTVRPTALIYCEGLHELIFARLLMAYYASNDPPSRPRISVKKGRGGSAYGLVEDAARLDGFDRKLVKLDNDRPRQELRKARIIATRQGITLSISTPCLEGLMLAILDTSKDFSTLSTANCRREFETKYVPKDKRTVPEAYERHLTKAKIDAARSRISELDQLIRFIEQQ